jgi:hypothetical protein
VPVQPKLPGEFIRPIAPRCWPAAVAAVLATTQASDAIDPRTYPRPVLDRRFERRRPPPSVRSNRRRCDWVIDAGSSTKQLTDHRSDRLGLPFAVPSDEMSRTRGLHIPSFRAERYSESIRRGLSWPTVVDCEQADRCEVDPQWVDQLFEIAVVSADHWIVGTACAVVQE